MRELYIGLMSGTSFDGVDIALCSINSKSCKLLAFDEYPFDRVLKEEIFSMLNSSVTLHEIGELHVKLGRLFAKSIQKFLLQQNLQSHEIKAIGLHGQTLWHAPHASYPFSMQLGDANVVVAQTGIQTITDFRGMDIAHGGEGAPFAPAFHHFLYAKKKKNIALVNIGGMANITVFSPNLRGWDSGCGNVLLDLHIAKIKGKNYDEDGAFARSGIILEELLHKMLQDEYFVKKAPKSTGREYFNSTWLEKYLQESNSFKSEDIQRTLLELTACSITKDLKNKNLSELIICGGGAKNVFLMQRLESLSCLKVSKAENSDAIEAMAFAWLGYKRVHKEIVELSEVTGAKQNSLLGAIYG